MTRRHKKNDRLEVERFRNRSQFKSHIRALGLASENDYKAWCRQRGLGDGLHKSDRQIRKERHLAKLQQGEVALARTRQHTRSPANTIRRLYNRELKKGRLGADYLYKIRGLFNAFPDGPNRRAFLEILLAAERRADLFRLDPVIPAFGGHPRNNYLDGMAALARHAADWVRPLDEWEPQSHNARKQFHHLACHLLARYDVPTFMDAAFFTGAASEAEPQQTWFKHIGAGQNIRTAELPVALSKKGAHHFLTAPDDLSIAHALRWAQVIGQGGSPTLARALIATRLGQSFEEEDFWSTAILFFANNPMLDPDHVGPIIDFIHNQKYLPSQVVLPGGGVEQGPPPQPNFSMKSRSIPKLLAAIEAWHQELAQQVVLPEEEQQAGNIQGKKKNSARYMSWGPSSIREHEQKQQDKQLGETLTWSVRELLSNRELGAEGREMGHCVYSYAKNCRNGSISIFSLGVENNDGKRKRKRQRILTIAVNRGTRTITQVRGRFNVLPGGKSSQKHLERSYQRLLTQAQNVLGQWMSNEALSKSNFAT